MNRECGVAYCHNRAAWTLLQGQIVRCDECRQKADAERELFPRSLIRLRWQPFEERAAR